MGSSYMGHTESEESPGYPNQCYPGNLGQMSNDAEKVLKYTHSPKNIPFSLSLRTQRAIDTHRNRVTHTSGTVSYMAGVRYTQEFFYSTLI